MKCSTLAPNRLWKLGRGQNGQALRSKPSAPGGNAPVQNPSLPPCACCPALAVTLPVSNRQFAVTPLTGFELLNLNRRN